MTEKTIDTLVEDMYDVIEGKGGWDSTISEFFTSELYTIMQERLTKKEIRKSSLRLSGMGTPCARKLWYSINKPDKAEPFLPSTRLKFLYGDMLEVLLLSLAKAAGHRVEGLQTTLEVHGVTGHRDAVIDGVTIDVKSASPYSFKKFKEGGLRDNDPFGYISQLSSYVYAGAKEGDVDSTTGAFLVIDKVGGHLCLDVYDFTEELKNKEKEIESKKVMVSGEMPERGYTKVPQSKTSPNTKIPLVCSYCAYKAICWPEARQYIYSYGPVWLIDVESEPRVIENTGWKDGLI